MHIAEHRRAKGLTQVALSKLLKVTPQTVANYEVGRSEPSITMLRKIAGILGVTVADLIGNG